MKHIYTPVDQFKIYIFTCLIFNFLCTFNVFTLLLIITNYYYLQSYIIYPFLAYNVSTLKFILLMPIFYCTIIIYQKKSFAIQKSFALSSHISPRIIICFISETMAYINSRVIVNAVFPFNEKNCNFFIKQKIVLLPVQNCFTTRFQFVFYKICFLVKIFKC